MRFIDKTQSKLQVIRKAQGFTVWGSGSIGLLLVVQAVLDNPDVLKEDNLDDILSHLMAQKAEPSEEDESGFVQMT